MNIRRIEKEDLPMIAQLAKDESLKTREDICYEHSKMCLSDDGEVLCFIVLRERSLIEFFNGNIPMDENVKNDKYYEEGDEWWVKEFVESYDCKHYEIIAAYLKEGVDDLEFSNLLIAIESEGGRCPQIGIFWIMNDPPNDTNFYHFNNVVWIDFPRID